MLHIKRHPQGLLPLPLKYNYGLGNAAEAICGRGFEFFLFFYYTQVLGVSGTLVGLALGIALAFDAINDPLMGVISDSFDSSWGRRHPFIYLSAFPLAISFYGLFVPPNALSPTGLFIWLLVLSIAARTFLTLFYVPYLSLGAEMTQDYDERTSVVTYRSIGAFIGAAAVMGAGLGWFFRSTPDFSNGQLNQAAYPRFALFCAGSILFYILWSGIKTHHLIPTLPKAVLSNDNFGKALFNDIIEAIRLPNFRRLFLGVLLLLANLGCSAVLMLHMTTYYWELDSLDTLIYGSIGATGGILALILVKKAHAVFDKKQTLITCMWINVFIAIAGPGLREIGFLPVNGSGLLFFILSSLTFSGVFFAVVAGVTGSSMMADIVDEDALGTGRRREGVFFGSISLAGKASSAIGHLVAGIIIDYIQFPVGSQAGQIPANIVSQLGLASIAAGPVFSISAIYFFNQYSLTRKASLNIQAALQTRDT